MQRSKEPPKPGIGSRQADPGGGQEGISSTSSTSSSTSRSIDGGSGSSSSALSSGGGIRGGDLAKRDGERDSERDSERASETSGMDGRDSIPIAPESQASIAEPGGIDDALSSSGFADVVGLADFADGSESASSRAAGITAPSREAVDWGIGDDAGEGGEEGDDDVDSAVAGPSGKGNPFLRQLTAFQRLMARRLRANNAKFVFAIHNFAFQVRGLA